MPKYLLILVLTINVVASASTANALCPCAVKGDPRFSPVEPISLSLPRFSLKANERVVSFRCEVSEPSGFLRVNNLWEMNIVNGTGSVAKLTADALEGEDALADQDLGYFSDFLIVGRTIKPPTLIYGSYPPFDIRVELKIATDIEQEKFRALSFSMKQLIIRPVQ
jgi:hypothetical protein